MQTIQKTKILFRFSIKKLFNLLFLFLFSCSSHFIQAEEIKPINLKCGSSSSIEFIEKNGYFKKDDKDFSYKLRFIDKNLNKNDYNFIYISDSKSSGGYTLELLKVLKKGNKHHIYFKENKPSEGSANIAAITATYCFLKINNLVEVEVFIK